MRSDDHLNQETLVELFSIATQYNETNINFMLDSLFIGIWIFILILN